MQQTIVIIGGGASGVSLLINIVKSLEKHSHLPLCIFLIEKSEKLGAGLAYSAEDDFHILNFPAEAMSPIDGDPQHFTRWIAENQHLWQEYFPKHNISKMRFPPRKLYGFYLRELAMMVQNKVNKEKIKITFINDTALGVEPLSDGQFKVFFERQTPIQANYILLCPGLFPATSYTQFIGYPQYIHNPWPTSQLALIPQDAPVCILGTRLTAVDTVLSLYAQGHQGPIIMVSRTGLLPSVLGVTEPNYTFLHFTDEAIKLLIDQGNCSLDAFMNLFWKELDAAVRGSVDRSHIMNPKCSAQSWLKKELAEAIPGKERHWQSMLKALYLKIPTLWNTLNDSNKRAFLKQYFSLFMIYFSPFPIENAKKLLHYLETKDFKVLSGIQSISYDDFSSCFKIHLNSQVFNAQYVINATATGSDIRHSNLPLLTQLLSSGVLQIHPQGGIKVDFDSSRVIAQQVQLVLNLFAVGNITRGVYLAPDNQGQLLLQVMRVVRAICQCIKDLQQEYEDTNINHQFFVGFAMKYRQLGNSNLYVSAIGLGCMRILSTNTKEEVAEPFNTAIKLGINFFDTADVYDGGYNEELVGKALKFSRNTVFIATKCGIIGNGELDGSYEYVKKACYASLKRLKIDYIDLFYLHRLDPKTPIEETMQAMRELVNEGKIKYVGLSKVNKETIRKAHKIHPITVIQSEYSLWNRTIENEGILKICEELKIGFVAYSPLGRGRLLAQNNSVSFFGKTTNNPSIISSEIGSGKSPINIKTREESDEKRLEKSLISTQNAANRLKLVTLVKAIAIKKNCTPAQLCLAWLLEKSDIIVPIPSTNRPQHLKENVNALNVHLSFDEMAYLDRISSEPTSIETQSIVQFPKPKL